MIIGSESTSITAGFLASRAALRARPNSPGDSIR